MIVPGRCLIRCSAALAVAVLTSACVGGASAPSRYYVLLPADTAPLPPSVPSSTDGPPVEVARVILPEYLNQPGILSQSRDYQVERADYDLWAGPLADEITRALSENLSRMVPTNRLTRATTRPGTPLDYIVEVEVVSFERNPANVVQLIARWSVFREEGRRLVGMRRSQFNQTVGGPDYTVTVAAMSRALADLSGEIAQTISADRARPPRTVSDAARPRARQQ